MESIISLLIRPTYGENILEADGSPVKTLQNTMCAAGRNRVQSVAALRRDEGHKKPNSIDLASLR